MSATVEPYRNQDPDDVKKIVTVWICPSCPNYYGSSNAGDLTKQWNHRIGTNERTFTRDRCPDCGDARVPCTFLVELEAKQAVESTAVEEQPQTLL